MKIEEITEDEIEEVVDDISNDIRKRLRRFAAEKKEELLLEALKNSNETEETRLRIYLDQTDQEPKEIDGGITVFERSYVYLVKELLLIPANAKKLLKKLIAEDRLMTKVVDGQLIVVFPQETKANR